MYLSCHIEYMWHFDSRFEDWDPISFIKIDSWTGYTEFWSWFCHDILIFLNYLKLLWVFMSWLWFADDLGLALLTLSQDKNWDSHSPMNGYPSFYPKIALVAPSPDPRLIELYDELWCDTGDVKFILMFSNGDYLLGKMDITHKQQPVFIYLKSYVIYVYIYIHKGCFSGTFLFQSMVWEIVNIFDSAKPSILLIPKLCQRLVGIDFYCYHIKIYERQTWVSFLQLLPT